MKNARLRSAAAALGICVICAVFLSSLACSLPWREYPVSSAVSGRLVLDGGPVDRGRVRLQVRSVDNATLGAHVEHALPADGGFFFEPLKLRVAGKEYGKKYVLLLYWIDGDDAATLWRADYSRFELGGPIELSCKLDRADTQGPPCLFVGNANDQPWLLAAGRNDYRTLCRSCHGEDGRGGGPNAGSLSHPPPDLTRIAARRGGVFPYDEIATWIDGRSANEAALGVHFESRQMPVWGLRLSEQYVPGGFTEARIRNRIDILVEYLDTLQQP